MVRLTDVTKCFHAFKAVDRLSFTVQEGETLVLLGTSGCGKTTTLKMINRLISPDSGDILINNRSVWHTSPAELRKGIGYVMQQHGLFPHYTIEENIGIVPALLGWAGKDIQRRTYELMEKLHLPPAQFAGKYPNALSGGQQQRVGLARALAANPPVLLMDEPFGSLDPVTRLHVRKDFMELEDTGRKTIIMVTHDIDEAFALGDRICLMHQGSIMQLGTPAELLFHPSGEFVQRFFDIHRMQLELQVITMRDVWAWLPEVLADDKPGDDTCCLPAATDCWQAMELLTGRFNRVQVEHIQQRKVADRQHLLEAISRFKQALLYN